MCFIIFWLFNVVVVCCCCCVVALMRKHHRIIANYYMKYMSGFDAQLMRNVVMVSLQWLGRWE